MVTQFSPWVRTVHPTYPTNYSSQFVRSRAESHFSERGFALTRSGETSASPPRTLAPIIITLVGFVLAFALTIAVRQRSHPTASAALATSPPTEAILFPPAPEVSGVSSAMLLAPAAFEPPPPTISPADPPGAAAATAPAVKHHKIGKKHARHVATRDAT